MGTCVNFACPAAWFKRPQAYNLQCYGTCTAQHCCLHPTTTPCPTTTPPTCVSFMCPATWVKRPQAYNLQCFGACTASHCCLHPTTTPCPTTTATHNCLSYVCPAPWSKRSQSNLLLCPVSGCTTPHCCLHPTPPASPCSTAPPAGASPCTTHGPAARLYAAKGDTVKQVDAETQEAVTASPAWALPIIGTLALLCCCLGGARALNAKTRAIKVDPSDRYANLASEESPVEAEFEGNSASGMLLPQE